MGTKEKIVIGVLAALAIINGGISANNFYVNHTILVPSLGGTYNEGVVGQPTYINPLLAHTEVDSSLLRLVYSGLYKYNNAGQEVPDLADGQPVISEDQKNYTVNLKKNVTWHNGKQFTADDVVFTIQTIKDPDYKSPLHSVWLSTTVAKTGDYQVMFTTHDVSGPFVNNLTTPILPKAVWGSVNAQNFVLNEANLQAVGTGPYIVKEIKKLKSGKVEQISFNSFPNYYNGRAKVDTVIIKFYDTDDDLLNALHSKEISGFGFTALERSLYLDKDRAEVEIRTLPLPQYQVVFFNVNNKILAGQSVRQALNMATDKQAIIHDVFKDSALLPASPMLFGTTEQTTAPGVFNIEKAKTLLDNDGWKIDTKTNIRSKKGMPLQFTIVTNDFILNAKAAEQLAAQWRTLNITITLNVIPTKQLTDNNIRPRNYDVLLFPQKFGADPDPFVFWHSSQAKDPGFNLTGFNDAAADKLITEARTTTNRTTRDQKYREFDTLLNEKLPVIFLNQTQYIYAVDKTIHNVNLHTLYESSQRFVDLPNWYMVEKRDWK